MSQKSILTLPDQKNWKLVSNDTVELVESSDKEVEFSCLMPGAKDFVSIKRNQHRQKKTASL